MMHLQGLSGKYGCIYADAAWNHSGNSVAKPGRNPRRHYKKTMSLKEVAAMPVRDYADDDCHLFFWITGPLIVLGAHLPIFEAWGFQPSSMGFVWVKPTKKAMHGNGRFFEPLDNHAFKMGMGHTTRQNAEYCIYGRRGKPRRMDASIRQVFMEPLREHSRKPDGIPKLIEQYVGEVRKAELFARTKRPGWDVWGDEIDKFAEVG